MADKRAKPRLLVVEDDSGLASQWRWSLDNYDVTVVDSRPQALEAVRRLAPAVVTLDLGLPPDPANASEGLLALQEILSLAPRTKVIVVTGNDDHETALRAVAAGAYDYFLKPVATDVLQLVLQRAYRLHDLEQENERLLKRESGSARHGVVAASPAMDAVLRSVEKVAPTNATVLLLGESGTGKELLARALHNLSDRADKPFVAINCAAIPGELLESELFGYEKGAFTGAHKTTMGKIEYADSGTLFLDEIGDLPAGLQAKLLRFLQERVIERVGGRNEIDVDVRVVCATHRDLEQRIKSGDFREDLYYRVGEVAIAIPPLRERGDDVLLIAQVLLAACNEEHERAIQGFSEDALQAMSHYPWRGNVRELENVIKRAVIMAEGQQLTAADLGLDAVTGGGAPQTLKEVRAVAERSAIVAALAAHGGNITEAARDLGVSRPTLYGLMERHAIDKG